MKKLLIVFALVCLVSILCVSCCCKDLPGTEVPTEAPEECSHEWQDATCEAPKTCSVCGETEGEALGHTEVVVPAVAPTCTSTGLTSGKKCTVCDKVTVAQVVVDATAHVEVETPAVMPTCTEVGYTAGKKCVVCNVATVAPVSIPAIGHVIVDVPAVEPTCTEAGLTAGKKCVVCAEAVVPQTKINALGHVEVTLPAVDATCTENGLTAGKKCTVCKEVTVAQVVVAATGHKEETIAGKAATCTENGLTDGKKCTVCKEVTVAQKEIAAIGHIETSIKAEAPTCTETGLSAGKKCTVCGEVTKAQTTVPALGHYEATISGKAATCTEAGITDGKKCTVCGEVTVAQKEIPAKGHKEVVIASVAATCTTAGKTEGKKCSVCGEVTVAQKEIAAVGHKEVVVAGKDATCTEAGKTEGKKCSVCGEVIVAQKEVAAKGHTEVVVPGKAATCKEAGKTEGKKCSVCGEVTVPQKEIAITAHTFDNDDDATCNVCGYERNVNCEHTNTVSVPGKDATCTEAGKTEGKKCADCGSVIVAQKEIAAKGHTEETIPAVDATCTETGLTEGKKCTVCGEVTVAQKETSKAAHTYDDENDAECNVCGEERTVACTHANTEVVPGKDATCTEAGKTDGSKCADCGETLTEQETVPATGHTEEVIPAVDATCTETGLTAGKKCSVCDEILVVQTETPVVAHTYDDEKDADCNVCGAVRDVACTHANTEVVSGKDATCTEAGLTEGSKCADCEEILVAQEVIEATGHTEETIPAVDATCTETGLTEGKKCSVCETVTEEQTVVDAKGHTEETIPAVDATCTETGLTEGKKCSVCETVTEGQTVVDEKGHTEVELPAVDATCKETGLTAGKKCSVCETVTEEQEVVPTLEHTWTPATCDTPKTCSVCETTEGEALGHNWTDATCSAPKTCTVCQATEGEAGEHNWVNATCASPKTCSECFTTEGEALGHTIDSSLGKYAPYVAPTCTKVGQREGGYCGVCSLYIQSVQIPTADHTFVNDICSVCNISKADAEKDPTYIGAINAINGLGPNGKKWNITNYYGSYSPNTLNPNVTYNLPISGDAFDYYCRSFTITGWALLDNGQGDMYWSDDGGKTWKPVDYQFFTDGNSGHEAAANLLNVKNYTPTDANFIVTIDLSGYADDEFVEICVGRAAGNGVIVNIFKFAGVVIGDEEREILTDSTCGSISRDDASNPVSVVSFDMFNSLAGVTDIDFRTDRLRVGTNGATGNMTLGNQAAWQASDRVIRILQSDVTTAGNLFQVEGWVKLDFGERNYELSLNVYRDGAKVWSKNTTDDYSGDLAIDAHLRETIFFRYCSPSYRNDIYNAAQGPSAFYSAKLDATILQDGDSVHFVITDKDTGVEYCFNHFIIKVVSDTTDLTLNVNGTMPKA